MAYVVAVLIALFGGWWVAATDALFRASERPGLFAGTPGMVLLLIATAGGGLLLAGGAIWIAQFAGSGSVAVIIASADRSSTSASRMFTRLATTPMTSASSGSPP